MVGHVLFAVDVDLNPATSSIFVSGLREIILILVQLLGFILQVVLQTLINSGGLLGADSLVVVGVHGLLRRLGSAGPLLCGLLQHLLLVGIEVVHGVSQVGQFTAVVLHIIFDSVVVVF